MMKINWGTGLAIGLGLFIIFILNFVIRIATQDKYNHELVTDNYYEKELVFQKEIDGAQNASRLAHPVVGKKTAKGYEFSFPQEFDAKKITGTVSFYRPSNEHLDFKKDLKMQKNTLLISDETLVPGRWDVKIEWQYQGESYFYKDKINY